MRILTYEYKTLIYHLTDVVVISGDDIYRVFSHQSEHRTLHLARRDLRRIYKKLEANGFLYGGIRREFEEVGFNFRQLQREFFEGGYPLKFDISDTDTLDQFMISEGLMFPV